MAGRDEGEHPSRVFDWGATKPDSLLLENPPGGGAFEMRRCCRERQDPQRRCAAPSASPHFKIPSSLSDLGSENRLKNF